MERREEVDGGVVSSHPPAPSPRKGASPGAPLRLTFQMQLHPSLYEYFWLISNPRAGGMLGTLINIFPHYVC